MENNVNEDQNELSIRENNFASFKKKTLIISLCIVLFYIGLFLYIFT